MKKEIFRQLPVALLSWYREHKRDLPWRSTSDPYCIWVSEIMLQQTRVEAVKGYYSRFLTALPTISSLANAEYDLLYKLWEGLGYYSRVRNMKKAAQVVEEKFAGRFPVDHEDVIALPGIGPYTAGAICSIAFGQKTPAIDGNVLRVISRLTNDATPIDSPKLKKEIHAQLAEVYPKDAGIFTQALMELGATVCGPNKKPECDCCPCKKFCQAYISDTVGKLPVKSPKRRRREEDRTVFILRCGEKFALEKRAPKGLLADMWQFPNVLGKMNLDQGIEFLNQQGCKVAAVSMTVERKHIFTHVQWNMTGMYLDVAEEYGDYTWMSAKQINEEAGLPTAFRMFWDEMSII